MSATSLDTCLTVIVVLSEHCQFLINSTRRELVFAKTLIVNSDGIEVEYFDFSAPRVNMEYSLQAVPRRYRTLQHFTK
jgi:hypothetical protein